MKQHKAFWGIYLSGAGNAKRKTAEEEKWTQNTSKKLMLIKWIQSKFFVSSMTRG